MKVRKMNRSMIRVAEILKKEVFRFLLGSGCWSLVTCFLFHSADKVHREELKRHKKLHLLYLNILCGEMTKAVMGIIRV